MSPSASACVVLFAGEQELDALGPDEVLSLVPGPRSKPRLRRSIQDAPIDCALGARVHAQGEIPDRPDMRVIPGGG